MRLFLALLPALLMSTVALAGGSGGGSSGEQIPVPEPASIALLIGGVGALIGIRARRRK
jgi:hypothetical protein